MAPETAKRDTSESIEPAPRNRQLSTEPVVLSDGSEDAPKTSVDEVTVATTVAAPASPKTVPSLISAPAPSALGPEPVRREAPVVPLSALVPSQVQPPPVAETEAACGNLVSEGLRIVETAERSATARPSASENEVPANHEPDGSIGAPEVHRAPMIGPLSLDWPCFPRSSGSFTFDDLAVPGRREAQLVQASTDSDASWAEPARDRFLRNFWLGYQVLQSLTCYRTIIFDANDGVYLELNVDLLAGKRDLPASVESRFWKFNLPKPSSSGQRTPYDYLRTQWAVTYGFGRIITFPEHDALRVNRATTAQFDVLTVAGAQQTQYRAPLEGFPALPSCRGRRRFGCPVACAYDFRGRYCTSGPRSRNLIVSNHTLTD